MGDPLPHSRIFQDRIAQVKTEIGQPGSGRAFDCKIWFACQGKYGVGRERVDSDVTAAFAKFESLGRGVGHHGKAHARHLSWSAPIVVVALDDYVAVGLSADKPERSGADGMPGHFV